MKIQFYRICLFSALLLFANACFAQNITITGLKEPVTIRRDNRAIPYIEARNEADLYFAQGYETAKDRLWQMDLLRRVARGETAEIFGRTALEEDKRWRKFGFSHLAEENLQYAPAEIRAALENYARGVNSFISALNEENLPVEFKVLRYKPAEWKPADSVVIGYILFDGLSTTWQQDLSKAGLADLPKEKLDLMFEPSSEDDVLLFGKDNSKNSKIKNQNSRFKIQESNSVRVGSSIYETIAKFEEIRQKSLEKAGFYAEFLSASNNWVISGKRTASGKPILANDPHLRASQPPIWHLVNLSAPGMRVSGVTIPGSPGVILGHNEFIAWGATNVGPDVQDLYLETFNAQNQYKTSNGWQTPAIRKEEIKIRKNILTPVAESETETLEIVNTRNGVVFVDDAGKKFSLKWTALEPKQAIFDAFYFLNRAKNWTEFQAALKNYGNATQNFIYADRQGNIGWYAAGKIPIRRSGDGSLPYDGSTDKGDWMGYIPFEELPHLYNPPENFIVTANQRTVGNSYKFHDLYARVFVPFRAKRIYDLIKANRKMTIEDSSRIQLDTYSVLNHRFAREIVKQKAATDETLKLLGNWDGHLNPESKAALLVDEIRAAFSKRILSAALGAQRAAKTRWANEGNFQSKIIMTQPKNWLPKEFSSYADLLKACENDARANLTKKLGKDEGKWSWGEAHKFSFSHPLSAIPLIGSQFELPVLPGKGSGGSAASPNVGASVSMRFISDLADWDLTRHVITTGENGDPKSPNWADQMNDWYNGNTPIFPFSKSAVNQAAKQTIVLQPK